MNLVLIGLPGSGKTTVGKEVAAELGMPFTDCDAAIEKAAGKSIPEIFDAEGEEGFRRREEQCLAALLQGDDQVIATGGGCVVSEENRRALQRARVVFLDREVNDIMLTFEAAGRPMMAAHSLQELSDSRRAWYLEAADVTVKENTVGGAVSAIRRWWRDGK